MSCKEWNVILNEDIEDCMPMLFILCTSITGVISELLDEEGVKLHMLEGFDEWTAGCFAGACGGHNEAYLGEIERFEVGEMPDGYTYLLERIPVLQEIRTENGSIKHHKTLIAITNGKETNKIVGLPTLWLEVKPDIEWFKDFQSAPTIMDFSMDVVGYCISDVTKILENFGKKQIRKIFEKQIMKFKKWEKEKEVHTTLSEEYYIQDCEKTIWLAHKKKRSNRVYFSEYYSVMAWEDCRKE